jgi:L-threonylcarbamoyladenylate synthase
MQRWAAEPVRIRETVDRLRRGAVIAFPTDTLYAIGARAMDNGAVARLYAVKRRPTTQPLVWLVADRAQAEQVAEVSPAASALMRRFWPGALTVVLPSRTDQATIGLRAPNHEVAQALLTELGEPIASSSANRAGAPPPADADAVIDGLDEELDIVLDGGPCQIGEPSTILDLSGVEPKILRQGAIPAASLIPSQLG